MPGSGGLRSSKKRKKPNTPKSKKDLPPTVPSDAEMESDASSDTAREEIEKPTRPVVSEDATKEALNNVMDYTDTWAEICTSKVLKAH